MSNETKILTSVSHTGLEALAGVMLAPRSQTRLNELLELNSEGKLSQQELSELVKLLKQVDELNLLKARAEYTLRHESR